MILSHRGYVGDQLTAKMEAYPVAVDGVLQTPPHETAEQRRERAANREVEDSLERHAAGYERTTERLLLTRGGRRIMVRTRVRVPSDPDLLGFWLKHRTPQRWGKSAPPFPEMILALQKNRADNKDTENTKIE
jgi:hypothetical protein